MTEKEIQDWLVCIKKYNANPYQNRDMFVDSKTEKALKKIKPKVVNASKEERFKKLVAEMGIKKPVNTLK